MNYQGAFECDNCPMNGDATKGRACPAWWETIWTRDGEQKIDKSCGLVQLPKFLVEVVKASNRPMAQMNGLQNEIAEGLTKINANVQLGFQRMIEVKKDGD